MLLLLAFARAQQETPKYQHTLQANLVFASNATQNFAFRRGVEAFFVSVACSNNVTASLQNDINMDLLRGAVIARNVTSFTYNRIFQVVPNSVCYNVYCW